MIKVFKQKRKFNYRIHTLYEDKIIVEYKTIKEIVKYEVKIDQIGFDTHYERENTIAGKIFFYFCLVFPFVCFLPNKVDYSIIALNFGIFYFLAIIGYFKVNKDDVFLIGHKNLVFYRSVPNENEVLEFIDLVISTSKEYLKSKYIVIDNHITEDEFVARLNWLLEMKIITSEELIDLKEEFKIKRLLY